MSTQQGPRPPPPPSPISRRRSGFVGDVESISQLAELGVIFLMFGVGLHFSLRDL